MNERFGAEAIVLKLESFPPEVVRRYYAMGDSAVVTPVHDGMNLVAKEYVASCYDTTSGRRGALVLSRFTGAAEEIEGAVLINPFNIDGFVSAIRTALEMPAEERKRLMRRMRRRLQNNTIFDWMDAILARCADIVSAQHPPQAPARVEV